MSDREVRFAKAGEALASIRRRNRSPDEGGAGCPILVEGRSDESTLRALGFRGPIEKVNRGWDRARLVAYLHETWGTRNPVDGGAVLVLLMDWDRTGGRIQHALASRLTSFDMKLDLETRMELARAMKPEGRCVEDMHPHAEALLPHIDAADPDGVSLADE